MINDDRKRLTKYIGECWHEFYVDSKLNNICPCGKTFSPELAIEAIQHLKINRTFTTPADMQAVKDKMEEKGDWNKFYDRYVFYQWLDACNPIPENDDATFVSWLFSLDENGDYRLCKLAADWLKERGEKVCLKCALM